MRGRRSLTTAFGQLPSQDNRGDPSRIELFQAQMIQSNELTLPDAAWFPNDKKGSDQRSTSVSNQTNDFANPVRLSRKGET
jgi:hypothetical protein